MTTTQPVTIEDSIDIDAPAERVWQLLSEPGWWINEGEYREHDITEQDGLFLVTDQHWGTFGLSVERSEPPHHIAYRWHEEASLDAPGTLTEFWVDERANGVTLRVRESGFETLGKSEEDLRAHIADNTSGWAEELAVAARHCVA